MQSPLSHCRTAACPQQCGAMLITSGAGRAVNPTSVVWRLARALRRLPPTLFSASASAALCFQAALLDRAVSAHIPVEMKEISPASAIGSSVMSWGGSDRLIFSGSVVLGNRFTLQGL
ncbi:UNVERIFIED_CONTAM: hypothetical protein FKN15_056707 [Acipenser sinensis]